MSYKNKPFTHKYNWEGINYFTKNFEKNNLTIALNMLYVKKWIYVLTKVREKQVILPMIPNGEGWHYLVVKNYLHY